MFKIGQNVRQEFGVQIMKIVDFEDKLIENVITQWVDDLGNTMVGKFSASQLKIVEN